MKQKTKIICKHCRKEESEHNAATRECAKGRKRRVLGYTWFGPEVFDPIEVVDRSKKEKFTL